MTCYEGTSFVVVDKGKPQGNRHILVWSASTGLSRCFLPTGYASQKVHWGFCPRDAPFPLQQVDSLLVEGKMIRTPPKKNSLPFGKGTGFGRPSPPKKEQKAKKVGEVSPRNGCTTILHALDDRLGLMTGNHEQLEVV